MKKMILLILSGFAFNLSKSQIYIKEKNLNADSTIRYFEIILDPDPSSFYINSIDYGQSGIHWNDNIFDSSGKKKKFRSAVELLNYISSNGWKLAHRDIVLDAKSGRTAFLLFERL